MSLTSFWFLYCELWTNFTHCSGVLVVDFDQVNVGRVAFCNPFCRHSLKRTEGIGGEVAYFGFSQIV